MKMILQCDLSRLDVAADVARRFQRDYPERIGPRDCVVYAGSGVAWVAHRTPEHTIVVREDHQIANADDDRPSR